MPSKKNDIENILPIIKYINNLYVNVSKLRYDIDDILHLNYVMNDNTRVNLF